MKSAGFTLIELLITISLSAFLMVGVSTMYINYVSSYEFNQKKKELLANARFFGDMIAREVRFLGMSTDPLSEKYIIFPEIKGMNKCQDFSAGEFIKPLKNKVTDGVCFRAGTKNKNLENINMPTSNSNFKACLNEICEIYYDRVKKIVYYSDYMINMEEGKLIEARLVAKDAVIAENIEGFKVYAVTSNKDINDLSVKVIPIKDLKPTDKVVALNFLILLSEDVGSKVKNDSLNHWKEETGETIADDKNKIYEMISITEYIYNG